MVWFPDPCLDEFSFPSRYEETRLRKRARSFYSNYVGNVDMIAIEPLLDELSGSFRKYSRDTVRKALDSVINQGYSVTSTSYALGIKRTSLQHYLKKLRVLKNTEQL